MSADDILNIQLILWGTAGILMSIGFYKSQRLADALTRMELRAPSALRRVRLATRAMYMAIPIGVGMILLGTYEIIADGRFLTPLVLLLLLPFFVAWVLLFWHPGWMEPKWIRERSGA